MEQLLNSHGPTTSRGPAAADADSMPARRVLSVDVLRGVCVAGMVLVNFPADWALHYHQLGHAAWNGATATDIIFPEFLFLSGFSMVYSFAARSRRGQTRGKLALHIVVRSLVLLLLGLLLNAVPAFDWRTLQVFGVLQRIAFCTLIGGLLVLGTAGRRPPFKVNAGAILGVMLLVLAGVWMAVRFVHVPGYGAWRFDFDGNLGAVIDRALFGNRHLSNWGGPRRMWDADGLLSCVTSVPNLLLGVLAAVWVRQDRPAGKTVSAMLGVAATLTVLGLALNPYLVINRKLWTDTFTILSGGISLGVFALFYLWLDGREPNAKPRRLYGLTSPALVYGTNPILGFVYYSLLLVLHRSFRVAGAHAPAYWLPATGYRDLCAWMGTANVSLLYGLLAVGLVWALLWPFYRQKIFLKL